MTGRRGPRLEVHPLTSERWDDFAALCRRMGPNRSCWCMWWREDPAADGPRPDGTRRERARGVLACGPAPGLLAYRAGEPVGWVAVAPRDEYLRLQQGRDTAPVDDRPGVWAVPCFFVVEEARSSGVAAALLEAAVAFAGDQGASAVEGVPVDPATRSRSDAATYTGVVAMFAAAGFEEVARRTRAGRVVMRRAGRVRGRKRRLARVPPS